MAKEQKHCEYCHDNKPLNNSKKQRDYPINHPTGTVVWIRNNELVTETDFYSIDDGTVTKINFCPMCGRKLS